MMTRKDFESIAHCLNANHAPLALVFDFADMLEEDNPRFDRARFVKASTLNTAGDTASAMRMLAREVGTL